MITLQSSLNRLAAIQAEIAAIETRQVQLASEQSAVTVSTLILQEKVQATVRAKKIAELRSCYDVRSIGGKKVVLRKLR
jgi:hypothetical protein